MARKKIDMQYLECVLTATEIMDFSKKMAEAHNKRMRVEESLTSYKAQAKGEIESAIAEENRCAQKISSGKEYREVECEILYDYELKTKTWVRKDTGEFCKTNIIPENELQEEMALPQ